MKITIIKYNSGNVQSVQNALNRLGIDTIVSGDHEVIRSSDKVIFPGVGEAGTTMKFLKEQKLDTLIKNLKQPVLAICLGLQLMCSHSEEGDTDCLGIFENKVRKFDTETLLSTNNELKTQNSELKTKLKVPQIGWNSIKELKGRLFDESLEKQYVYFVHSYYAEKGEYTSAITEYGIEYSSALEKDNFYAVQFHPEKSGTVGEKILKRFIEL